MKTINRKLVSSIGDVARSQLATVGADALLLDAAKLLAETPINLVVVCDSDEAMVGVITKTNIVRLIGGCCGRACRTLAAQVMTSEVTACRATDGLRDVLSMMQERGFTHIPLVDSNSRPIGIVNARDVLRELMVEGDYEEGLLRDYVMGIGYQ